MANHPIDLTNGRHNAAKERAEGFFDIYLAMGDQRSLPKLQGILADGGLTITVNTLKNYSVNYDWQGRIVSATDKAQTLQANNHATTISEMNNRQARVGSAMLQIAGRGLVQVNNNIDQLTPRDTGYLADIGVKLERLARGEATTRAAIEVEVLAPVIHNIVALFQQVNVYDDADRRKREFGVGADRIIEQAVDQVEP
jgi:hypothetical protein